MDFCVRNGSTRRFSRAVRDWLLALVHNNVCIIMVRCLGKLNLIECVGV